MTVIGAVLTHRRLMRGALAAGLKARRSEGRTTKILFLNVTPRTVIGLKRLGTAAF